MKKIIILFIFVVNLAFGQSVTISPTDTDNTLIQKSGTAQMSIKGNLNGANAGKSILNLESNYQFIHSGGTSQTATSTINFNSPTDTKFSIKHSQYSYSSLVTGTTSYSWLSVNNGTSEIARFEDDAFVPKKVGVNNYNPFYQLSFNSSFGDKISFSDRTCSLLSPLGGCATYDDNHFGIGYQSNLFQVFTRDSGGDIAFGYGKSASMTERVRFKGNGFVGIGVNPAAKLHISGTENEKMRLENTTILAANVTNEMFFKTGSYFTGGIKTIGVGSAVARLGFFTFADASSTNLLERMSISDGGNVGIGTTAPIEALEVVGNTKISGEVNRTQTSNANIVPIAYGNVNADGTLNTVASTSNVSITKSGTGLYIITITGETFSNTTYTASATINGPFFGFISVSGSGVFNILTANSSASFADIPFTFVVYKK